MRAIRRLLSLLLLLAAAYAAVLAFPQPMFEHRLVHGQYDVRSDRPIPPEMRRVLDDVTRRLERSELYGAQQRFRVFLCNDDWRMALYSQRFSSALGGAADDWLGRNIFIRRSDVAGNRIFPPSGRLADAEARPLSYFIAHEATHIMDSRALGRIGARRAPRWLREGYADYVAKGGDFDFEDNRARLIAGDPLLDPERIPGLYRRHHLIVAMLIERDGLSVRRLYANPPDEAELLRRVRGTQ